MTIWDGEFMSAVMGVKPERSGAARDLANAFYRPAMREKLWPALTPDGWPRSIGLRFAVASGADWGKVRAESMTARMLLQIAMFLGIALAPVKPVLACAVAASPSCHQCCAAIGHSCCAASKTPPQPAPLAPAGKTSDEGQQLAAPTLLFLCLSPIPVAETPAVQRQHAARLPALPLRDLICVRLV